MRSYLLKPSEPSIHLNPQDCVFIIYNAQKALDNINILVSASLNMRDLQCAQLYGVRKFDVRKRKFNVCKRALPQAFSIQYTLFSKYKFYKVLTKRFSQNARGINIRTWYGRWIIPKC